MPQLPLKEYSSLIHLKEKYTPSLLRLDHKEEIINELLETLLKENDDLRNAEMPRDFNDKRKLLRGLLNRREPKPLDKTFLIRLDSLLQYELNEKEIVPVNKLQSVATMFPRNPYNQSHKFVLWQGDITRLDADAIVNAANNQMLGCFQPLHACIDNAIHSAAGPRLREDCAIIMSAQGELEETGSAKITRANNLPSRFVLHTVGPIVPRGTPLTEQQNAELTSCYVSCLELAHEIEDIKSIAFCAISTGVFGFPKTEAAHIAVHTVNEWLSTHSNHFEKIIFNVFSKDDYDEYVRVFRK